MQTKKVKLLYFSPTGTTQKILESIAKGMKVEEVEHINLTLLKEDHKEITFSTDDIVVIGTPVYGGRLPLEAVKRLEKFKASKTLAIIIVLYGNRDFEDALLELKNLAIRLGFAPFLAAAFIGEHSFSTMSIPIAIGRPDYQDIQKAVNLGENIKNIISTLQTHSLQLDMAIPGRFPYESKLQSLTVSPDSNKETCSLCGVCVKICPTKAISITDVVITKNDICIHCCACIKNCTTGSRFCDDITMKNIAIRLNENFNTRKEPRIWGVEV